MTNTIRDVQLSSESVHWVYYMVSPCLQAAAITEAEDFHAFSLASHHRDVDDGSMMHHWMVLAKREQGF
jgi:hypothetical protein